MGIFDNWKKSSAKILGLIIREDLVKYINYEYIKKVKINGNRDYNYRKRVNKECFFIYKKWRYKLIKYEKCKKFFNRYKFKRKS